MNLLYDKVWCTCAGYVLTFRIIEKSCHCHLLRIAAGRLCCRIRRIQNSPILAYGKDWQRSHLPRVGRFGNQIPTTTYPVRFPLLSTPMVPHTMEAETNDV